MVILLNVWIFPIEQSGGDSRWRVCYQRGLPRLVLQDKVRLLLSFGVKSSGEILLAKQI